MRKETNVSFDEIYPTKNIENKPLSSKQHTPEELLIIALNNAERDPEFKNGLKDSINNKIAEMTMELSIEQDRPIEKAELTNAIETNEKIKANEKKNRFNSQYNSGKISGKNIYKAYSIEYGPEAPAKITEALNSINNPNS